VAGEELPLSPLIESETIERSEEQKEWLVLVPIRNPFLRRLAHETVRAVNEQLVSNSMDGNRIGLDKSSTAPEARAQLFEERKKAVKQKVGFRRVLDMVSKNEILVLLFC
jgi:hypothetical protein